MQPALRMKLGSTIGVYAAQMIFSRRRRPLLARLRSSARLTVMVLLVFALKIGAAAACAKHDFADLGLGGDASQTIVAVAADSGDADPTKSQLGHLGNCTHCGCHHAAAVVPTAHISLAVGAHVLTVHTTGPPPSAVRLLELRPPIA